jgi:flagellar hook-basal body complex protein FliE
MANLNVETLNKIVQSGDIENLFTGSKSSAISDSQTEKEMQSQGLHPTPPQEVAKSFSDILKDSVEKVNSYQTQADAAIKELVAGRSKNIHETMLTIERADTSLKLMMQVRNKILDAYREIMRMQV